MSNKMINNLPTKSVEGDGLSKPNKDVGRTRPHLKKVVPKQGPAKQLLAEVVDKKPKTEGHAEVYKYICAQHDKWLASRESIITRLGNVRLLAGILLSILALSFPVVIKEIEASHSFLSRLLMLLPLLGLLVAICFVLMALLSVPKLVAQVDMGLPGIAEQQLKDVLAREELDFRQVIRHLSQNYIASIETNKRYNREAGQALDKAARYIRVALIWTITFLGLTLAGYILSDWSSFPKPSIQPSQASPIKDTPNASIGAKQSTPTKSRSPSGTAHPTN